MTYRTLPAAKRMRLSKAGEIRALSRLTGNDEWTQRLREVVTMVELADIEIIEATVQIETDGSIINLDEDTSRQLYALAWERFEKALIETNALYNETPDGQTYHFNRVKRLLWEVDDLKRYIDTIYRLTAMPDELIEDDEAV